MNVLEVIAPFKHFNKLREFVQMKLPPGFPVKLGKMTFSTSVSYPHFQEVITFCVRNLTEFVYFKERRFSFTALGFRGISLGLGK